VGRWMRLSRLFFLRRRLFCSRLGLGLCWFGWSGLVLRAGRRAETEENIGAKAYDRQQRAITSSGCWAVGQVHRCGHYNPSRANVGQCSLFCLERSYQRLVAGLLPKLGLTERVEARLRRTPCAFGCRMAALGPGIDADPDCRRRRRQG